MTCSEELNHIVQSLKLGVDINMLQTSNGPIFDDADLAADGLFLSTGFLVPT